MLKWIYDIANLIFPKTCAGCNKPLLKGENTVCLHCISELPDRLGINKEEVSQRFYGRINLEEAHAYLLFKRKGITQKLLHSVKYNANKELAKELGKMFGRRCKELGFFKDVDVIVPIPLHKSKLRLRGYNQSELLALGMAEEMDIILDQRSVIRNIKTATQTRKTRLDRWKNVEHIFEVINNDLKNKHVLLVDDVITTGATLESCAQTIMESETAKISVACLALA